MKKEIEEYLTHVLPTLPKEDQELWASLSPERQELLATEAYIVTVEYILNKDKVILQ